MYYTYAIYIILTEFLGVRQPNLNMFSDQLPLVHFFFLVSLINILSKIVISNKTIQNWLRDVLKTYLAAIYPYIPIYPYLGYL